MTDVRVTKSILNMRSRRVKARAEGNCITCCKNPSRPARVKCAACSESDMKRNRAARLAVRVAAATVKP